MSFTAKDVSELRQRTGAGMMDCKKALEEAGGNMEAAAELLRKKGIAKAEKRAGRSASQGLVAFELKGDRSAGAMVEVNCETDFVARTEDFRGLAKTLAAHAAAAVPAGAHTLEAEGGLLDAALTGASTSVGAYVKEVSAKTGEAVTFKRAAHFAPAGGVVGRYLHHNEQVGVLVELTGATGEAASTLADELALHIASADPMGVRAEDIPADVIDRERRIAEEQVAAEGKPEAMRAKIVDGKIRKFVAERTLLEQLFIKDESRKVGDLVNAVPGAHVVRFARFKVGES